MKIKSYLCLTALIVVIAVGCQKEGAQGPQGPQGAQGIPGPAGLPGSTILSGNGAPAANTGADGDYYLNKTNAQLYGPKTAAGWGSPVDLKGAAGATGAAGTPGSQIHSGNGAPAAGVGVHGDFYFDRTDAVMYGPKTTNGWGTGVALRIGQVISYIVTNTAQLTWNSSHYIAPLVPIPSHIRQEGLILFYASFGSSNRWLQIPGLISVTPLATRYAIRVEVFSTGVFIDAYNADGTALAIGANPPDLGKLRVVMIPADQVNTIPRISSAIDFSNYENIKELFPNAVENSIAED